MIVTIIDIMVKIILMDIITMARITFNIMSKSIINRIINPCWIIVPGGALVSALVS